MPKLSNTLRAGVAAAALVVAAAVPSPGGTVGGSLMRWHGVEVSFQGPSSSETASAPNPFLDYRLQCLFTGPSGQTLDVPGFYDANGSGGTSGNVWKCRLAPDEPGRWRYVASFRSGSQVAVATGANAGSPASFDGDAGEFTVQESDKSGDDFRAPHHGLIVNPGDHYLAFRGNGKPFLKGGPNIPENLLGYAGFDNTPDAGHDFDSHVRHWRSSDPDWGSGKGKGIIGALNYIADAGGNSIYFLPMNVGGDGNDTFPTVSATDKTHYDTSKLAQWETVFTHADRRGIFLHVQLAETESGNENYHDGGSLGVQRMLFYRELIARFGHHLGLQWDLGEENDYGASKHKAFAAYLRAVDPYDHPITTHSRTNELEAYYGPLLGNRDFAMTAFQVSLNSGSLADAIGEWRRRSAAAGVPWVVSVDEPQAIENDLNDESRGYPHGRRRYLWPTYMAGGGGFEWYVQEDGGGHGFDQRIDDFSALESALRWTRIARDFLLEMPLPSMRPRSDLSNAQYTLADPGIAYAMYSDATRSVSVDLSGYAGEFEVTWLNPRSGQRIRGESVTGGGTVSLGSAPFTGDAAVRVVVTGIVAPAFECEATPRSDCRSAGKSKLIVRRADSTRRDKIAWVWKRGETISPRDLGLPTPTQSYALCVYDDDAGQRDLVASFGVPAQADWRTSERKTAFRDLGGSLAGIKTLKVVSGEAGKASAAFVAIGDQVDLPDAAAADRYFHGDPEVTVQMVSSGGLCAGSTFASSFVNVPTEYRAVQRSK
jgi:hypothetical protein